jgi:hypothetical protein
VSRRQFLPRSIGVLVADHLATLVRPQPIGGMAHDSVVFDDPLLIEPPRFEYLRESPLQPPIWTGRKR